MPLDVNYLLSSGFAPPHPARLPERSGATARRWWTSANTRPVARAGGGPSSAHPASRHRSPLLRSCRAAGRLRRRSAHGAPVSPTASNDVRAIDLSAVLHCGAASGSRRRSHARPPSYRCHRDARPASRTAPPRTQCSVVRRPIPSSNRGRAARSSGERRDRSGGVSARARRALPPEGILGREYDHVLPFPPADPTRGQRCDHDLNRDS
jgi:hypothetical protein